jgi:elongation factor G
MGQSGGSAARSSRCIALVGPYLSGKTTLLEAILARTGGVTRQGRVADKNTVGDASAEARDHGMTVEVNIADAAFLGDNFTFIDCPGSIEFQHESSVALTGCDAAVVVSEPDPKRVPALQLILKQLEDRGIPRFLFLNKIDSFDTQVREILPMLQPASSKPLVLRQRMASHRASSISLSSAHLSTASTPTPRSSRCRRESRSGRRKRDSRCSNSLRITTTS